MNKADYAAQRLDPRWQRKRMEVMEHDGFACVDCDNKEKTLNVHHDYYVTGRMPWNYPMFSLNTLCRDCHKARHEPPPEGDHSGGWQEWETEMDWILCGNQKNQGNFWDAAASINELAKRYDPFIAYITVFGMLASELLKPIDGEDAP